MLVDVDVDVLNSTWKMCLSWNRNKQAKQDFGGHGGGVGVGGVGGVGVGGGVGPSRCEWVRAAVAGAFSGCRVAPLGLVPRPHGAETTRAPGERGSGTLTFFAATHISDRLVW